jgi:hypothetical protein
MGVKRCRYSVCVQQGWVGGMEGVWISFAFWGGGGRVEGGGGVGGKWRRCPWYVIGRGGLGLVRVSGSGWWLWISIRMASVLELCFIVTI